jgi:hypothetical protein
VVGVPLLRGSPCAAPAVHRTGDRQRPWRRSVRSPLGWHTHLLAWLVAHSRARAQDRPPPGEPSQDGQPPASQGSGAARQSASAGAAPALVQQNDTISHEDVQTANRLKSHHLAKRRPDAGWAAFVSLLTYTAACAGRRVVAVPPASTSQTCSGCGVVVSKGLSVRWHACPECGPSLQRDHNAAKKRERAGQALQGGVAVVASENRASAGL